MKGLMRFRTWSGSVYEVLHTEHGAKARRVEGKHPLTPYQNTDLDEHGWKPLCAVSMVSIGRPVWLWWSDRYRTQTSPVTEILPND